MMRFVLGVLTGFGAAWAALAIWQHRAVPDIDPAIVPGVDEMDDIVYYGRRPSFRDSTAGDCTGFRGSIPYDAKRHEGMYP
ncbi:hypothetical protein HOT31_gp049 [Microbacterium phage Hendrix]|uniref:Uncharacterized protein n=1 Tax=Microbacterium phage Hendrix TaxID=2182341 RepID=A0A2U8UU79_9CAUD|nr:hypothetical protein HOT31_gp049 [Microbacterium phage Hendrix]AWN07720.1 hypothetical protein PBI_HENDRIX_49 [Microbacterium phage Hendrix]